MIKDIIDILRNVSLRHKGVRTFRYQNDNFNNAQNDYDTYQIYVDTVSLHRINITTNIFLSEFEIYILGHPSFESGSTIEDVQTEAYTIAVDIMGYLDNMPQYKGILSVYDFSILTLEGYSNDKSSGVKLSLTLQLPSPLDLCTLEDNFNDEPYEEEEDDVITISNNNYNVDDISLTPIKLPKNRDC